MKPKFEYTNSQISHIIDEHIHNAKVRNILKLRFIDGLSFEQIAEHPSVDLSVRYTQKLFYDNETVIYKNLFLYNSQN